MPFPYQASGAPVRTRRVVKDRDKEKEKEKEKERDKDKEKDARSTVLGSSKKQKEVARASNRSPSQSSRSAQSSLYTQTNITLDQLPPLPRSETTSPSSTKSPVPRANSALSASSAGLSLSGHPYTPAALQPYLEDDNDDPENASTPQASSATKKELDLYPPSSKPLQEPATASRITTPSPKTATVWTPQPPLPPTDLTPPFAKSVLSEPRYPQTSQPLSPALPSIASPRPINPAPPFFGGPSANSYLPYQVPTAHYLPIAPGSGRPMELHNVSQPPFYAPYSSSQQMQPTFNPLRSPPAKGHGSTSSRVSFSSDQLPGNLPLNAFSGILPNESGPFDGMNQAGGKTEDDAVLQRIQNAIPDLHRLLNRYRETSGQLSEREVHLRESELQKTEVLKEKDGHVERLSKELNDVSTRHKDENNKHAEEKSKLRLEIGNMTEKHNELQDNLLAERKKREEVEVELRSAQSENDKLILRAKEMSREFDDWKAKTDHELSAIEKQHADKVQRQIQSSEITLQVRLGELSKAHALEKDALQGAWAQQKRELEDCHSRVCADLSNGHGRLQKELDENHKQYLQERDAWNQERDLITKRWEEERAALGKGSEELRIQAAQHRKEKEELQRAFEASEERIKKGHAESISQMQAEIDNLKTGWDVDKDKFRKTMAELNASAAKMNDENIKLQKLAQAFGEVTDLKSREDPFFKDAFNDLHRQISCLAEEHFSECPTHLPNDVAAKIPQAMPSFSANTEASNQLRSAYIESLVSSVLNERIFQHFLFTHPQLDRAFNEWAGHIRSKSTKREALWRQYTLHAAFTCQSSKQLINAVAADIVEDIVITIRHFASRSKWARITAAVRKIVKTAAETWRYASLELPRIVVSSHSTVLSGRDSDVILSLFPRIERERNHVAPGEPSIDQGCIYSPGYTLQTGSASILRRRLELGEDHVLPSTGTLGDTRAQPILLRTTVAQTPQHSRPRSTSPLLVAREEGQSANSGQGGSVEESFSPIDELHMNETARIPGQEATGHAQVRVEDKDRRPYNNDPSTGEPPEPGFDESLVETRPRSDTTSQRLTGQSMSSEEEGDESEVTPKPVSLPD
ncbi:MAG: hypothetical protein LQ351_004373 [Letrouitia transgressa]|nr:MAG: hypothetical protein LQ351_004373 [Letrouitia transgressa]